MIAGCDGFLAVILLEDYSTAEVTLSAPEYKFYEIKTARNKRQGEDLSYSRKWQGDFYRGKIASY